MELSDAYWKMADQFVGLLHRESQCPLIVCDYQGIIRASTDRKRIGTAHAGAKKIMSGEVDEIFVTAEDAAANSLMKEGYNFVIRHKGERVGTFGIAGKLEVVKPLARVASVLMAIQLRQLTRHEIIEETASTLFQDTDRMIEENRAGADQLTSSIRDIEKTSKAAIQNVGMTDEILTHIEDLVAKTNILRINGAIEATRAGIHGRAFAVVVNEMKELAEKTKQAAVKIDDILVNVRSSIQEIANTMEGFSEVSTRQIKMYNHTATLIASLKKTLEALSDDQAF